MKIIIRILIASIILGTFAWTIYFLYKKSEKKAAVYKTESPFKTNIIKKTVATGSVVPRKEVLIKSQVSGIIEKIFVQAGTSIKKGDIIAKIKIIPNMVSLNDAENRLERAKISHDQAKLDFERNKNLLEKEAIAKTDLIQYQLAFSNAKLELQNAIDNLDLIKEGVTKKGGEETNTLIRSTISGMILDIPVKEGNSVIQSNTFNDGTTIASVADMGEMIFEGKVDESEVGKIKKGMDLILTVGAIENKTFKAKLEYIAPKGVAENGAIQFLIKAAIDLDKDFFLRAAYSANADIVLERRDSVLAIQEGLLQFSNDSVFVEVETAPQKFEKRIIKTGLSDGINIEVLNGLSAKEKVKGGEVEDEPKTEE